MKSRIIFNIAVKAQCLCKGLVLFFFLIGLLFGFISACYLGADTFLLMSCAAKANASIVELLVVAFLPFIFTISVKSFFRSDWILLICFFRSFCFSFCSRGLLFQFEDRSWLIIMCLMFTSVCSLPLDCWLWLRCYCSDNLSMKKDYLLYAITLLLTVFADSFFISPLMAHIFR